MKTINIQLYFNSNDKSDLAGSMNIDTLNKITLFFGVDVNGLELPAESSNSRRLANCLLERLEIFSFPGAAVSRECPSSRLIFRALRKITSVLVSTLFASMVIKQTVIQ